MTDDLNTQPQAAPAMPPKKRRRWTRILARLTGTTLLIVLSMIISASLGMAWLASDDGRAFLVNEAEKLASNKHMTLDLGSITRLGFRHLDIDTIRVSDKDGPALAVDGLSLTIDFAALMAGQVRLNEIRTDAVTFDHAPATGGGDDKPETPPAPFTMPSVAVEQFVLNNIHITTLGEKTDTSFDATGSLNLPQNLKKTALTADIKESSNKSEIAHIRLNPQGGDDDLALQIRVDDDGTGLLGSLTGLPHIHVAINGAGPADNWQGTAMADLGAALNIDGKLDMALNADAVTLTLTGETKAAGLTATGAHSLTWRSATGRTAFSFKGRAAQSGMTIPKLALEAGLIPQPSGGMNASLTALAEKIAPAINSEVVLALNARQRGNKIMLENSYLGALGERIGLAGTLNTETAKLDIGLTGKIASLGRMDNRFGGAADAAIRIKGRYAAPAKLSADGQLATQNLMTPWEQATIALGMAPSLTFKCRIMGDKISLDHLTLSGADQKSVTALGWLQGELAAIEVKGGLADYTIDGAVSVSGARIETENLKLAGPFGTVDASLSHAGGRGATEGALTWRSGFDNTLTTSFQKTGQHIEYKGNLSGKSVRDYMLDFAGDATLGEAVSVTLAKLDGSFGANTLRLPEPAILRIDDTGAHPDPITLKLNDGDIRLSGDFGKDRFESALTATALPANMDIFPLLFDGRIDGDIALSGPYTAPTGKATLALKQITLPGVQKDEARYVDGGVTVTLGKNRADFSTRLSGTAGLKFNATGFLPVSFAPVGIPADKPLQAALDASVDLRALTLLLGLDEHRLAGQATLDVQVDGTLDAPNVTGTGGLEKGRYENLITGTLLRNITTQITANNNRLTLSNLTGADNNSGSFSGEGAIDLRTLQNPAYTLGLSARRLNLVSLDRLGLVVSGDINSRGDAQAAAITGDITIDNGEYYITKSFGGDALSDFEVVETGEGLSVQTAQAPPPSTGPDVTLDIGLKAEHSIYVRGPDLESEWGADLHLGGTAAEPALKGRISLVRGQYRLLDTTVKMKKGVIGFTPPAINDPDLDLSGELKGNGETAIINVTGSAGAPTVELTSESGLKDDELLAQVLFGKSLNELSPMQALRIARLMANLSGHGGGGFDPLAEIRRAIGVDALSVGMDDEGGATLSVGKYVSDKVYLSVDQGATPESSAARVEIEVTDEIEIESSASGTQENTVGVNWKRDY